MTLTLLGAKGAHVHRVLDAHKAAAAHPPAKVVHTEASFRWALNEDEMATLKTAEGIRAFAADLVKLEKQIEARL